MRARITYLDGRTQIIDVLPIDRRLFERAHKKGYYQAVAEGLSDAIYWPAWSAARRADPSTPDFDPWIETLADDPQTLDPEDTADPTGETSDPRSDSSLASSSPPA